MKQSAKVIFEDGNYLHTEFNGSKEEATAYYVGQTFNLGVVEDNMVKAVSIEFIV